MRYYELGADPQLEELFLAPNPNPNPDPNPNPNPNPNQELFLVLASDGVWEHLDDLVRVRVSVRVRVGVRVRVRVILDTLTLTQPITLTLTLTLSLSLSLSLILTQSVVELLASFHAEGKPAHLACTNLIARRARHRPVSARVREVSERPVSK